VRKNLPLIITIAYIIVLSIVSVVTISSIPSLGSDFDDKVYHFLAYALLTFILYNYIKTTTLPRAIITTAIIAILYGTIIEVLQNKINAQRTFDIYDILANFLGVVCAAFIVLFRNKLKLK